MTRDELLRERDVLCRRVDDALDEQEMHLAAARGAGEKARRYLDALRELHMQYAEAAKCLGSDFPDGPLEPYWWMDPQVQRDREAFMRAVAERMTEWQANKERIDALCGCLKTMDWGVGDYHMKRRGFGGRVEVLG